MTSPNVDYISSALLYLIAAWAIVRGIFEIITAIQLRKEISLFELLRATAICLAHQDMDFAGRRLDQYRER